MRPVHHEQRFPLQHLKTAGPGGFRKPLPYLFHGNRKSRFRKRPERLQRQNGIVDLPGSHQRNGQIFQTAAGKTLPLQAAPDSGSLLRIRHRKRTAFFLTCRPDHLHGFLRLFQAHYPAARLDDSGLLYGDLSKGISQRAHVIHADGNKHADQRRRDHVGRVLQTAHSRLQHHNVAALFLKPEEGQRRFHFKISGMRKALRRKLFRRPAHPFHISCVFRFGDHFPVHLKALPMFQHCRRGIGSGPISCPCEHGREHGEHAAFAVGARDVDILQLFLRISQLFQKPSDAVKSRNNAVLFAPFYIFQRFLIIHVFLQFRF